MEEYENEFELMDYLNVIWKRKWLIIIPTFILVVLVGIYSLTLPKVWEIDAIIVPSKIILRTDDGQFEEVLVVNPKQTVGQINQASYNNL
ncbi:MAG: Wzz/FepE/Etk N-terminal domain-containing protein, partial [Candidatus Aminicenantes bacterium]|nr:Wzz/FepE/Etk N-terminal domain-containing protein [Candidatus Aminicenantes bacterium]